MRSSRIIGVIDADAFEISIYQRFPEFKYTKGTACILTNGEKSKRIVSVSWIAKRMGISRSMTVHETKKLVPDLITIPKDMEYNKPESRHLRSATTALRDCIVEFFSTRYPCQNSVRRSKGKTSEAVIELNGSDEFFIDLTRIVEQMLERNIDHNLNFFKKVRVECLLGEYLGKEVAEMQRNGFDWINGKKLERAVKELAYGAEILQNLCKFVKDETGFTCSAGVGENKVLSKIACKLHKPAAVVLLTRGAINRVAQYFPFREIPGFGGELGDSISKRFNDVSTMEDLQCLCTSRNSRRYRKLQRNFSKEDIEKIHDLSHGKCDSEVEHRLMNNYISSGKQNLRFERLEDLENVMEDLAQELVDRIKEEKRWNSRKATKIKFSYIWDDNGIDCQRTFTTTRYKFGHSDEKIVDNTWEHVVDSNDDIDYHLNKILSVKYTVTQFCYIRNQ